MDRPVTTIDKALINGGVTDGTRTVFYQDVESVIVETTSRRPLKKKALGFACGLVAAVFLLLFITLFPGSDRGFFLVLIHFLIFGIPIAAAFIAMEISKTYFETVLQISTRSGLTKLVYTRSWHKPEEIGTTIAEVLNERRGLPLSPETLDQSYSIYINKNHKNIPFFRLENDQLNVYSIYHSPDEEGYDSVKLEASINLKDAVKIDCLDKSLRYRNGFESNSLLGFLGNPNSGMQLDLVFTFRSGRKVTHFVKGSYYFFKQEARINDWELFDLLEKMGDEISKYINRKQSALGQDPKEEG